MCFLATALLAAALAESFLARPVALAAFATLTARLVAFLCAARYILGPSPMMSSFPAFLESRSGEAY
jgi:hypothetical protein